MISSDVQRNGPQLSEEQIRKIIRDEINQQMFQAGKPNILPHIHDDINSPKIPETSIIYPTPINGTIDMAQATTYILNLTSKGPAPRNVTFYGGALNAAAGVHIMIVGSAQIGANQQFQPSTSTSVITGPVIQDIIQGSASITAINAAATFLKNSQGHIIYGEYPSNTLVAVGDIISVSNSQIKIQITTLASGWSISGLWVVS